MRNSTCCKTFSAFAFICTTVLSSFGGTAVWTGGSGNWSEPANWRDGALPQAGDTVYVSNTVADITLTIDVADVSIASIRFEGASPVKLSGNGLTLTGGYQIKTAGTNMLDMPATTAGFLSIDVEVDCDVPIHFAPPSGSHCGICTTAVETDFRQKVTSSGNNYFYIHNGYQNADKTKGVLRFHDEVDAPDATFSANQHPTGFVYFNGKTTFAHFRPSGWTSQQVYLTAAGNSWPKLSIDYGNRVLATVADAFPANCVFSLWNTSVSNNRLNGTINLGGFDTTIDRLGGDTGTKYAGEAADVGGSISSSTLIDGGEALPATLTMKATQDDMSAFMILDAVSLVWDPVADYTLTLTGRIHQTKGNITVNRGGVRLAGKSGVPNVPTIKLGAGATFALNVTDGGALTGLKTLTLGANARFAIENAVGQSCPTAVVNLGVGAKLAIADGAELDVCAVCVGGAFLEDGTYSNVDWIDGDGSVKISSAGTVCWKNPEGGNWSDGSNWTGGKPPSGTDNVMIALYADTPYVVTVDQDVEGLSGDFYLGNDCNAEAKLLLAKNLKLTQANVTIAKGGLVEVPENAIFEYVGPEIAMTPGQGPPWINPADARARTFTIENGGELRTSGGFTSITNFLGAFTVVGATPDAVGKLTMSAGTFLYMNFGSQFPLTVGKNGAVETTGGTFRLLHHGYNHITDMKNVNGTVTFKDTSVKTEGTFATKAGGSTWFTDGETVFEGTAVLDLVQGNKTIRALQPGGTATVTARNGAVASSVQDNAAWAICGDQGTAVYNWDTGADAVKPQNFVVGANRGKGFLNVKSGLLRGHSVGFTIGSFTQGGGIFTAPTSEAKLGDDNGAVGQVTVESGAALLIPGSLNQGWYADTGFKALLIGDGRTMIPTGRPYVGRLDLYGALTNEQGAAVIGLGRGEGSYVQHAGWSHFCTKKTSETYNIPSHLIVGMAGGLGRVIVSNGNFKVSYGDFYLGGCSTNVLGAYKNGAPYNRVPWTGRESNKQPFVDLPGADGTLSVVNGTVSVNTATILGADGTGTLEMIGSRGSFTTKDLVLSNQTASVVRFVADAEGVAPVKVTDTLTITGATRIDVDLTGYQGSSRRHRLFASPASVEGELTMEKVHVTSSDESDEFYLSTNADGDIVLRKRTGACIILQ